MIARSLGISAPSGNDVYEIYIVAKSNPGALGEISGLLGEMSIDILQAFVQVSKVDGLGYYLLFVEMMTSKISIDELLDRLRKMESTIEAKADSRNSTFFEITMFPLTSDGHSRVFAIGADEWLKSISSLKATFGTAADSILFHAGLSVGESLIENMGKRSAKTDKSILVDNFRAVFSALGLGKLSGKGDGSVIEISIDDPPVKRIGGINVDEFLVGIVAGGFGQINSSKYNVRDLGWSDQNKLQFLLAAKD
ncbi:MAG: hypothetical protein ACYC7D_10600 [Nitrososphaerales archaeon]